MIDEKVLPEAIVAGVPYDVFWKLDPNTMKPFIEAYRVKKQNERDLIEYQAWINGAYISRAITNAICRKKYPDNPINKKYNEEETESMTDAERFEAFAIAFNVANTK